MDLHITIKDENLSVTDEFVVYQDGSDSEGTERIRELISQHFRVENVTATRPYRVNYREEIGDRLTLQFDCLAEDVDHAEEQCLSAFPCAKVFSVVCLDPPRINEGGRA